MRLSIDAIDPWPDPFPVPSREQGRRISPTTVAQFIRLDQCQRFLRLALHERVAGPRFLYRFDVAPQEILPLLTRSGAEFEEMVERAGSETFPTRNLARERTAEDKENNDAVVSALRELAPGHVLILFQPRLRATLGAWDFTGDADIVRAERDAHGVLRVLIADMKASTTAKVEHRLQVAFYREMLERLLTAAGVPHEAIAAGILYRGAADGSAPADIADAARREQEREDALRLFAVADAQLELTPDPDAYRESVRSLVTSPDSVASRGAGAPFAAIPWHLTYKCDGCLYNELCMKWAADRDDLSLLPHLSEQDKSPLQAAGISTTSELANLLEPVVDPESGNADLTKLRPAPGKQETVRRVSRTWPVGPRLDEMVHRARRYRSYKGDPIERLTFIPSKGYGSLPYSAPDHNPNLVRVFIDAQHDYLNDRLYLIGTLVVGNEAGEPRPERRRVIVDMTDAPPDDDSERRLLVDWIDNIIRAIAEVAAPDENGEPKAPIHLIFYNGFEQKLLLQALNRHMRQILGATPLYDFITQRAAFDSPVATFLDQEIRELKNYPMVCQSLQAVASWATPHGVRFDWDEGIPFRRIFRERMFDSQGRQASHDGTGTPWYTRRARFNSQIPLEYAYAAWGEIAPAGPGEADAYEAFRGASVELMKAFQQRRLEAMEHISADFTGNRDTTKTTFTIPDLASFDGKARGLAEALQEFVTIERHVDLAAWKSARLAPPERRVLAGDTLLVRYLESDQLPGVAETYRENLKRRALREEQRQRYFADHPGAKSAKLSPEEKALSDPIPIAEPFRLRIDVSDVDVSVDDALALSTLKADDWVVIEPRWTVDSRLPPQEQQPLTPTPKQLLYGMRLDLAEFEVEQDRDGRATNAWLHVRPARSGQSDDPPGFLFRAFDEDLNDGEVYTVDPDPNDIYGFWGAKVVQGLLASERNTLFSRVAQEPGAVRWPAAARAGQARFMAGLQAVHEAGAGPSFEPSKVEFIGERGDAPLLLVQGPPGTGKSFTTAYAILARMQGALAAGMPFRVLAGAKTHAATDVLLESIADAQERLRAIRTREPELFLSHFDDRLLDVPLFRLQVRRDVPTGVTALRAGSQREKGDPRPFDIISARERAIVASTPGGVYSAAKDASGGLFGHDVFDLLVLDEASQLSLPESIMAALALKTDCQVIVIGDHRQMAPIVKHDWENETRRTFQEYAVYRSLFDTVRQCDPVMIQFAQSFRLDRDMAEFLRRSVYAQDDLWLHSERAGRLRVIDSHTPFVQAALNPDHPLIVIVHDEAGSQLRNDFERDLTTPLLTALHGAGYQVRNGFGLVVPHRAQRANLQDALRHVLPGAEDLAELGRAVDTVERFQGGERDAIIVSATESDPAYLLAAGRFLYDPRRLTVAMSRAKDKMILVAARSVFSLFSPDEQIFANAQLWKNLLGRTCTVPLWDGEIAGRHVEVWGNPPLLPPEAMS